jgi:osmotically-inducible protein OsmY
MTRARADKITWQTQGVRHVVNDLKVEMRNYGTQ